MPTRRAFLAGLAAAVLAGPAVVGQADEPALTRGWRWTGGAARTALGTGSTSAVVRAPYEFNAIGVAFLHDLTNPRVRFSPDGGSWSEWNPVTTVEMHGRVPSAGQRYFADLVVCPPSRFAQVAADGPIPDLQLDFIDSSAGPSTRFALAPSVSVIRRRDWGCDERLRYDNRGAEIWTPQYAPTEKLMVHHTVTANQEANPAATVRSVYYYHAVSQGWGDVGYHYLVDWRGNVYEGRHGGPGVEAGHAYGHNSGSIGIACLGTYSTRAITTETRQSLTRLIANVAPYLDPHDSSWFVDGEMPNLMGHRDAMRYRPGDGTSCPGDALYALLPGLRGDVAWHLGDRPTPRAELVDVRYEGDPALPGGLLKVHVTVRNTGTATLSTQDSGVGTLYEEGQSYASRNLPGRTGVWRLGFGLSTGGYPLRWGLPEALEPGKQLTVTGTVRLGGVGVRDARLALVREGRGSEVAGPDGRVSVIDPASLTRRTNVPVSLRRSGT